MLVLIVSCVGYVCGFGLAFGFIRTEVVVWFYGALMSFYFPYIKIA